MSKHLEGIGITLFDSDSRGGNGTATLTATRGTLAVTAGNSGIAVTANNAATVSFTGTMAQLDALFRGTTTGTIIHTSLTTGIVTFSLTVTDEDNLSTTIEFAGTVSTFIAPVVAVPGGSLSADVNTNFIMDGIGFSVTDADDTNGYASAVLACTGGTLTVVTGTSGCSIVSGNSGSSVTIVGTVTSINNLLTGTGSITYMPTATGSNTLSVIVTDENGQVSNTGSKSIAVASAPVVIPPTNFIASTISANKNLENASPTQGFSYTDIDDDGTPTTNACTMVVTSGTIDITVGNSGVTITNGTFGGVAYADVTDKVRFTGTKAQINNLLQKTGTGTIVFNGAAASVTLTVQVTDSTARVSNAASIEIKQAASETWTGFAAASPAKTFLAVSNFVVPIDLSRLPVSWWSIVSPDGRDVRVTLSTADSVALPRDLVRFNYAAKTGLLFAKTNTPANSSLIFHVWAGAPTAIAPADLDADGREAVYDSSTVRAWWPDGGGEDRTGYDNDLTIQNGSSSIFGATTAPFGMATNYGANNVNTYSKTTVAVATDEPETFCAYINCDDRTHETVMGATHDTKTNVLHIRQSKVTAKTYISDAAGNTTGDSSASAVGDIDSGAWKFVAAEFISDNSRVAFREGTNSGGDFNTWTETGSAGDLYFVGATVRNPTTVVSDAFRGKIGLCFILTNLAEDIVSVWQANYSQAMDQVSYWTPWTFSTGTQTGL